MPTISIEPILVHAASRSLTLPEVAAYRETTIADLLNDAEAWGLVATGPWTFVSGQIPQDSETPFELIICRPIEAGGDYGGEFQIIELPAITAATAHFEGPIAEIYATAYAPLLEELLTSETPLSGEVRELYHVLPDSSSSNVVDIQIGLAVTDEPIEGVVDVDGHTIDQ